MSLCVLFMYKNLRRSEKDMRFPGTTVTGSGDLPQGCWKPNTDLLQEQQALLNAEPYLQSHKICWNLKDFKDFNGFIICQFF